MWRERGEATKNFFRHLYHRFFVAQARRKQQLLHIESIYINVYLPYHHHQNVNILGVVLGVCDENSTENIVQYLYVV